MRDSAQHHHRHVVEDVPMQLMGVTDGDPAVIAELHYSTRDPFAVQATFRRGNHTPVVWVFARDLVLVGTARGIGDGDVQFEPFGDYVVLTLRSPDGSAQLLAPTTELRRFAARMLTLVPAGDEGEFFDFDAELAELDPAMFARDEA